MQSQTKRKTYDEDIPVCVCGKPFIIKLVCECYDGSGVGCDECGKNIAKTDKVYHCPADKNNVLHTNGYDLCMPCYATLSDQVNTDNILFQIWFIINDLNKCLYHSLTSNDIHTRKALISKSSFEIFQFLMSIDWKSLPQGTTMKRFCDRYDALKAKSASIKDTSYKYNGSPPRGKSKPQNNASTSWSFGSNPTQNVPSFGSSTNSLSSVQSFGGGGGGRGVLQHSAPNRFAWSSNNNTNHGAAFRGAGGTTFGFMNSTSNNNMNSNMNLSQSQNWAASSSTMCNNSNLFSGSTFGGGNQDQNIGFSVGGGAKDINTFRLNIEKHHMPSVDAISCQGIFNDYYFDTNAVDSDTQRNQMDDDDADDGKNEELPAFYPSYSCAKSRVPKALLRVNTRQNQHGDMIGFDEEDWSDTRYEYYLTVGLNSNIKETDFKRKKLNLCVVLDISGSMGSSFTGGAWSSEHEKSKMRVANECLLLLLTHLHGEDRFGLVVFDTTAEVKIEMDYMKNMEMEQMDRILDIRPRGGTNFECGYKKGVAMYCDIGSSDEYENRLIFLTDAHPNVGCTDSESLLNLVSRAANQTYNKIYTTFVGIGVDFNANLVSKLTDVRGANQFSVHTNKEFKKKLHCEFDYFVSPMVFNLRLSLFCEGSRGGAIDAVFGSDHVDITNGEIMKIKTLFPSPPNETGDVKGGIVLIRLKYDHIMNKLPYFCEVTFEDKFGRMVHNKQKIFLGDSHTNEFYPNLGVRKGVLLVRYVSLIKDWIQNGVKHPVAYNAIFNDFKQYFQNEIKCINDDTLNNEVDILNKLIRW